MSISVKQPTVEGRTKHKEKKISKVEGQRHSQAIKCC